MEMKNKWDLSIKELDYYHVIQPIIDITIDRVFGYEMLLRSTKFKNPEFLFNYAEQQDLLYDLDMHSIHKAFKTINDSVTLLDGLHLFINILPSTISNPKSLKSIQQLKSSLKLDSNKVVFEITEERKEEELIQCKSMIGDMKEQGFLIALDDIGKGDSTIPYVIELEPHVVKLDRYFSIDLATSRKKQKAIELMLHIIDDETIIILEGIENEDDLQTAKELGIRYVQGFHLGKPELLNHYLF